MLEIKEHSWFFGTEKFRNLDENFESEIKYLTFVHFDLVS